LRGSLATYAKWAVSLGLLGGLLLLVDLGEVYTVLRSADPLLLAVAFGFALADRLLMAGKWLPLLKIQIPGVSPARAIRAYFASTFAGLLLPASVGGDVIRTIGVGRDRKAVMEVGASVVLERVLGLVGSGIIALVSLWIALKASVPMGFLVPWVGACVGAGFLAVVLPFSARVQKGLETVLSFLKGKKWISLLERFGSAYGMYQGHARTLVVVGFLSVIEQIMPVLVFWASTHALHLDLSFESLMVAVPLTAFAGRLPISVAGIGVIEGGLVYLLGLFGAPATDVLSLAVVNRVVGLFALIPGAFWWKDLIGSWDASFGNQKGNISPSEDREVEVSALNDK